MRLGTTGGLIGAALVGRRAGVVGANLSERGGRIGLGQHQPPGERITRERRRSLRLSGIS